ncbi:MAG: IclR family transcriptional regulator [Arthrospira platensis]
MRAARGKPGASDEDQPRRTNGIPHGRLSSSLQSGLTLLLMFSAERETLGIADMASLTGLTRPTTHRYARTLVHLGYMERDPSRKYRLAPSAADPGTAIIREVRRELLPARDTLERLRELTGHTVSMGVLDGLHVTYVHRFFGHRPGQHKIDAELRVGARIPAYCTALGKVTLASLPDTERRERVEAIHLVPQGPRSITMQDELLAELDRVNPHAPLVSNEEFIGGGRSIAALVQRRHDELPIAIDVTMPSAACTVARLRKEIGPLVMQATRVVERP